MHITCCYNCAKREPGCHGKCELYLEQKEEREKKLAEKAYAKSIEKYFDNSEGARHESINKFKKHR